MLHEISFSHSPIEKEVLSEERPHNHSTSIMHVATVIELPHCGVDDRISSFPVAPSFKVLIIIFPVDISILGFERCIHTGSNQQSRYERAESRPTKRKASVP